jgi:hypothetical protein
MSTALALRRNATPIIALLAGTCLAAPDLRAQVCTAPSFHAAATVNVGGSPMQVILYDFNNDGINDLATANLGSDNVSIELGNGDGTFTQASGSPVSVETTAGGSTNGTRPEGLAAGDFDEDGKPDLAVALRNSNQLQLLTGDGDGGFSTGTLISNVGPSGSTPDHIVVGDFNGDGHLDMAVGLNGLYTSGGVAVFLGNGHGGLSAAPGSPMITSGGQIFGIVAGHFTGTAPLDLAVTDLSHDDVLILQGAGNGSFTKVADIDTVADASARPFEIATADVNRDGLTDLLVANNVQRSNGGEPVSPYNGVAVLIQQINHSFAAPVHVSANGDILSVASADFNVDGLPDFVVANAAFSFGGTVRLGNGTANFTGGGPTFYAAGGNPYNVAAGTLVRGYGPGFVVVNQPSNTLSVYLNDCDAIFRNGFETH